MSRVTKAETELLNETSVLSVDPVLFTFPFAGIHHSVDTCAIFRFELLHNFSLRVIQLQKACISKMLGDERRGTSAIKKKSGFDRTFKALKVAILFALNMVSTVCQKGLIDTSLRVDLKKLKQSNRLTGLFTEVDPTSKLERAELNSVDVVFPF